MKQNNSGKSGKVSLRDLPITSIIFSGKVGFWKLAKATFIFTAAPAMIISIFIVNHYIGYDEGVILFSLIFVTSLMFNYPYIADLQEITGYVDDLANNKNPEEPALSFINNLEGLSVSINKLNNSWQEKNDALKVLLLEDEILINSLPNVVLMLDKDLNFLQTNQAAKNIFGWNYGQIITDILSDEKINNFCLKALESGESQYLKYEIKEPYFFLNINIEKFPINSPNKIALVLIIQNLTTEKKTEKMLSDFVANASHEMKTPLSSIMGFIETLSEVNNDPKTTSDFLKIMKDQSDRMNRLINDLLVLSVAEAGVRKEQKQKINLTDVVQESLVTLTNQINTKKIKINTQFENFAPKIDGYYDDLLRLTDNLIGNAVKYSSEGTEVIVSVFSSNNKDGKLKFFSNAQKLLCFSVRDFGEGIDEKYLPRLTERFFRVDKARSRNLGGAGLGLAIVKQIAENHDAYFEIKSQLGEGSTFSVYFPIE